MIPGCLDWSSEGAGAGFIWFCLSITWSWEGGSTSRLRTTSTFSRLNIIPALLAPILTTASLQSPLYSSIHSTNSATVNDAGDILQNKILNAVLK
ncbi:hypothetical protein J4Q44_G00230810 [Coregonus suidteri]|uniref:Uncharacterized protein n=1 Tax=Coregonus suidteri TaxID=861788 RepID=A0AAN8QNK0_9TELE